MAHQHQRNIRSMRRGMTLIELLMVVAIMTVLLAVAVPMLRPAFQDRQLREGARQINAFFAGAKARAAETGRSVGVWIEVMGDTNNTKYAMRMYMAEVPPGFTGSSLGSRATIQFPPAVPPPAPPRPNPPWTNDFDTEPLGQLFFWMPNGWVLDPTGAPLLNGLVSPGEKFYIRFDHKGAYHSCLSAGGGVFFVSLPTGMVPRGTEHPNSPPAPGARPVGQTFEIVRGPNKSIVSPLQLPGDTVIDLTVSGVGVGLDANTFFNAQPGSPIVVMFTPSGEMGAVYVNHIAYAAPDSIYLMVGRRAKVVLPASADFRNPEASNLADPTSLWITINNRTGAVTTEDNNATHQLPGSASVLARIKVAREFARGSRQKGGR